MVDRQPTWDALAVADQPHEIAKQSQLLMQRFVASQADVTRLGMGDRSAGVISAPGSKYGHWTNDDLPAGADQWLSGATSHQGSWWPVWDSWVTRLDDVQVPAREPGGGNLPIIEDAPGPYVRVRAVG